jgi:hypothetical protein
MLDLCIKMPEDALIRTAGLLKHVGQDRQLGESPQIIDGLGYLPDRPVIPVQPIGIETYHSQRTAIRIFQPILHAASDRIAPSALFLEPVNMADQQFFRPGDFLLPQQPQQKFQQAQARGWWQASSGIGIPRRQISISPRPKMLCYLGGLATA